MAEGSDPAHPSCEAVLPDALLRLYPEAEKRVPIAAGNVATLIDELDRRWPGMGDCLRDSRPAIRRHIAILVDGERLELSAPIAPGTTVFILTAISGG